MTDDERSDRCPFCDVSLDSYVCQSCGWPRIGWLQSGMTQVQALREQIAAERAALDRALDERDEARRTVALLRVELAECLNRKVW